MPITYAEDHFTTIESRRDDRRPYGQGTDGYGRKITTKYLVRLNKSGPWRRVYCTLISNSGSVWITVKGVKYHFRGDENLHSQGEWPKN